MAVDQAGELTRSDPAGPGISRRGCGRGFRYFWPSSAPVRDPAALARIKALVIPPAWEQVWICPEPEGHIQAVGTDAAGRRQYLYIDPRVIDRYLHGVTIARQLGSLGAASKFGELATQGSPEAAVLRILQSGDGSLVRSGRGQ